MNKPIQTEAEYQAALERLEIIFDAIPGSKEAEELDQLSKAVEDYENIHYPIDKPEAK